MTKAHKFESIQLGDRVKDPITGLHGIATCITTWLHGYIRIGLQPESNKDGKTSERQYFDQSQLVVVKKAVHQSMVLSVTDAPPADERRAVGGPNREGPAFKRI